MTRRHVEIAGKSGALYRYSVLEEDRVLPPAGANYVICKPADRGVDILFVGETDSLARIAWREQLAYARDTYGDDADVLTRLNVRSAVRLAEQEDLLEEYKTVRQATRMLFQHMSEVMILKAGTANNAPITPLALAFLVLGHAVHHKAVLVERYYPLLG